MIKLLRNFCSNGFKTDGRPSMFGVTGLGMVGALVLGLAGCASLVGPTEELVATSSREVQTNAWESAEKLVALLDQVDSAQNPGIAALVQDLQTAAAMVNSGPGGNFESLDAKALIADNPHFWRASLEMAPGDGTVAALEALVLAAAGEIEAAGDVLELLRAGPLLGESLDRLVSHQRNLMRGWRLNPPSLDVAMNSGYPPPERWQPLKALQANYPDSPTVAMAVLRMRAELAGIELVAQGEDQRMRNKILAAEPRTVETLEAGLPLWAAIIKADGEASDAAKRIADAMTPDSIGVLNLSAADFEKLIADFMRIGLPDWALRSVRLKMGETNEVDPADVETLRQLLPMVVGTEQAAPMLASLPSNAAAGISIFPAEADPVAKPGLPMDRVVAGHYERRRRDAMATLQMAGPTPAEEQEAWLIVAESERMMGNFDRARAALATYAQLSTDRKNLGRERLSLAIATHDSGLAMVAREELKKADRRMQETHFIRGIAEVMLGNDRAAADAFMRGYENEFADADRRAFSALHAHGAAQLAGESRIKAVAKARTLVKPDAWIAKLLSAVEGEMGADQLLAQAAEGRDYLISGQRCEAHFALAFAPGQTEVGRREHLEACVNTGMVGYIEYDIALAWLRRVAPQDWPVPPGAELPREMMPAAVESARPRSVR